jgi:hypothetical protein
MYTKIAPTVIPNIAIDMAIKAKWYHMVTLKMRVKRISCISVARATMNRPMNVPLLASFAVAMCYCLAFRGSF